ncbi:MAG: hypothetical protein U9P79_09515 [Candidatus Cloacimonadota bacterium]|nr:hypothetical protein [Candidatus Cloacimonadota bacterium]
MKKIDSLLWEARHHANDKWLLSVELLEQIIEIDPKVYPAHELLYIIYMQRSLFQKTEKIIQRAMKYFPDDDYLKFLMGNVFLAQKGKSREAITWYKRIETEIVEMDFNLAVAYTYQDEIKKAVKILKKVFTRFNHLPKTYIFFAEQYLRLKEYDNAIDLLTAGKKKFPSKRQICYLLGVSYNRKRDWIHAFVNFNEAHQLGYNNAEFYNTWANCCFEMGNSGLAVKYFTKSIQKNIFFLKSYLDLSRLYVAEKKFAQARRYLELAKRIDPLDIYVTLATQQLKRIFKTLEDYEKN